MTKNILILTSKTGGGHISIAEALRDRLLEKLGQEAQIHILDPQSTFIHWHYRMVSRYALWLWSAEFRLSDTPERALSMHRLFTLSLTRTLRTVIQHLRPDLIISTYPFLTYEVMQALKRMPDTASIPFAMIFTDPNGVHASWLTEKRATMTLAPTRETYVQALAHGFARERLRQVGWPVRTQFTHPTHRNPERSAALLQTLQLEPGYFTVFVQGGGEGAARIGATIHSLLQRIPELQIILATGTNRALQQRFQHIPRVYPLPFTREIAPYMAAADVIMGKAGPNMLFEAVTLGKPFIATAYIPGQEEANLEFIRRHGLGKVALTLTEQQQLLRKLVTRQAELHAMTASVAAYQQWNEEQSAESISALLELLQPVSKRVR
jgi:processive 1,2-diacylglycerol beta-glucosyltransferase